MPTFDEIQELESKCSWEWTTQNSVNGQKVTGPNGNSIFLPAAGSRWKGSFVNPGNVGDYWSSPLYPDDDNNACLLRFNSRGTNWSNGSRIIGQSVRAVCP